MWNQANKYLLSIFPNSRTQKQLRTNSSQSLKSAAAGVEMLRARYGI